MLAPRGIKVLSSETRIVRPYVGGDEFQRMLDVCRLRCADRMAAGGDEVAVGLDDYLNFPFALVMEDVDWGMAEKGAEALGIDTADIDLLVLLVAPRLRFVDTIFRRDLASTDGLPRHIPVAGPERPRALRAPHGGADLRVYFCLNKTLKPRPVHPWRRGTWLGQQQFRIRSELAGAGFVPIRLTAEDRAHLGLPRDTVRFATLDDADPFDPEPGTDTVKLYVDGELLDRLAVAAGTPAGRQIQRQLFLDAAAAISFAAQRRFREEPALGDQHVDDFRGSLVHKLTELIAGKGTDSATQDRRQVEFQRLRDTPTVFIAQIEAKTGIRSDMLASLGDPR